jgi:hypothetical protein
MIISVNKIRSMIIHKSSPSTVPNSHAPEYITEMSPIIIIQNIKGKCKKNKKIKASGAGINNKFDLWSLVLLKFIAWLSIKNFLGRPPPDEVDGSSVDLDYCIKFGGPHGWAVGHGWNLTDNFLSNWITQAVELGGHCNYRLTKDHFPLSKDFFKESPKLYAHTLFNRFLIRTSWIRIKDLPVRGLCHYKLGYIAVTETALYASSFQW